MPVASEHPPALWPPICARPPRPRIYNVTIHAVSKSQVPEYADKIDLLLLGPHFSAEVPKYRDMLKDHHVKVASIDPDNYASLDGEAILEEAIDFYNEE